MLTPALRMLIVNQPSIVRINTVGLALKAGMVPAAAPASEDARYVQCPIRVKMVKSFGIFILIGVIFGTFLAVNLKTPALVLFFSIFALMVGLFFIFSNPPGGEFYPQ